MNTDDTPEECRDAWSAIRDHAFHEWAGVPDSCEYADFDDAFPRLHDEYGRGTLGSSKRQARFRRHDAEEYSEPLKVWFRDGEIVLIETPYPAIPDGTADLLDRLGEPAARFDYEVDVVVVSGGSWVYPSRGLAVFLDADGETVNRVSLFHACSLDEYTEQIRQDTGTREFPLG